MFHSCQNSGTQELCTQPTGYVEQYGDCDDSERYVNPDQAEQCGNNVDDNCNEVIDEETKVCSYQLHNRRYLNAKR